LHLTLFDGGLITSFGEVLGISIVAFVAAEKRNPASGGSYSSEAGLQGYKKSYATYCAANKIRYIYAHVRAYFTSRYAPDPLSLTKIHQPPNY
jgi:hypothetical protein